jgi:small subunit ribosomal protein S20
MATHKSAKKRIRSNERRKEVNKTYSSKIKNSIKKVMESSNKEEAEKLYKDAVSVLDRGTTRGIIKKNTASRNKSKITRHLNSLKPAVTETKE